MTAAQLVLAMSALVLTVLALLALGAWVARRRDATVRRQIRLTEAISEELGAIVAPVVTRPLGGPWRAAIRVDVGQPATVSRIVAIAHDALTEAGAGPYELVLTPGAMTRPPIDTRRG
jgi:hypothetical protein